MAFGFIIIRLLFIASMVFIIGYIFGGFAKRPALATLAKISAILVIVLFIAGNAFFARFAYGRLNNRHHWRQCDSAFIQQKRTP